MAIGGDPDDLRRLATRLRNRADTLSTRATSMANHLVEVHWSSNAATSYRARLGDDVSAVEDVVDRLEELAADFDDLADTLAERQRLVGLLLDAGIETAREAAEAVADGVHDGVQAVENVLRDMGAKGRKLLEDLGGALSDALPLI